MYRYRLRTREKKTIIVKFVYRRVFTRERLLVPLVVVVLSVCTRTFTGKIIAYYPFLHNKHFYHTSSVCVADDIPRCQRRPLSKITDFSTPSPSLSIRVPFTIPEWWGGRGVGSRVVGKGNPQCLLGVVRKEKKINRHIYREKETENPLSTGWIRISAL